MLLRFLVVRGRSIRLLLLRLDLLALLRWLLLSFETPLATWAYRTHRRVVDLRIHNILECSVIWIRILVRLVDILFSRLTPTFVCHNYNKLSK